MTTTDGLDYDMIASRDAALPRLDVAAIVAALGFILLLPAAALVMTLIKG